MSSLAPSTQVGAPTQGQTLQRTVVVVDMVAYGDIARLLEQNINATSVADLNRQIQTFISRAFDQLPDPSLFCIVTRTGDGIIALFERSEDAHHFARHVHLFAAEHNAERTEATAQRWFRIGIATGEVSITACTDRPDEYAGTTIANAVRLEGAATPGEIIIDTASFALLSAEAKALYTPETTVTGKRDERFRAHRLPVICEPTVKERHHSPYWSRRGLLAAGSCAALTLATSFWTAKKYSQYLPSSLPIKRFVLLVCRPVPADEKVRSAVQEVVALISSEMARAEGTDRNFWIIEDASLDINGDDTQLAEHVRSLGANLILEAFGWPSGGDLHLDLTVRTSQSLQVLRREHLRARPSGSIALPQKAVKAAARLLDVQNFNANPARSSPNTVSPAAYSEKQHGDELYRQENDEGLDRAILAYKRAIDLDDRYASAYAGLALAYCRVAVVRHNPTALSMAFQNGQKALSFDPFCVAAHQALASILQQRGEESKALQEIEEALTSDPTNALTMIWQAQLYTRLNRWSEAEETFRRIILARPNRWLAHNELGALRNDKGEYPAALEEFRLANLAAPNSTLPLNNIGAVLQQLGRPGEATTACKRSLEIKPSSLASATLAAVLRCQGHFQEARQMAINATSLDPDDSTAWLELGDCCTRLAGKETEASHAYLQALSTQTREKETDPTYGPGYVLLALYLAKAKRLQDASDTLAHAQTGHIADMDSQLYQARCLELLDRRTDALQVVAACRRRGATAYQVETTPDLEKLVKDEQYLQLS